MSSRAAADLSVDVLHFAPSHRKGRTRHSKIIENSPRIKLSREGGRIPCILESIPCTRSLFVRVNACVRTRWYTRTVRRVGERDFKGWTIATGRAPPRYWPAVSRHSPRDAGTARARTPDADLSRPIARIRVHRRRWFASRRGLSIWKSVRYRNPRGRVQSYIRVFFLSLICWKCCL